MALPVLIVGAGPTGLVLGLWLARLGVRARIIDKAAEPGTTSRALAVQARTLELYRQMDLADPVQLAGRRIVAANLWTTGRRAARAVFGDMGRGISPYPYALIYPQDEHERLLIDRLAQAKVDVERRVELRALEPGRDHVLARLTHADGREEHVEAAYVAGCDGAHSMVRQAMGIGFQGATYEHLFYVADVNASGPAVNGEVHVALDVNDFLVLFPLKTPGRVRLIGTVRETRTDTLSWDDVSRRVIEWMHVDVASVNWFSTYRVHHRVATRFQAGRVFLLGDAAHIHSPVGGQGMNTGIGDAVNLAWKLAGVVRGEADPNLLDSYERERIAFARKLVATTDRAFIAVTSSSRTARWIRLRVVPAVLPTLFSIPAFRRLMFRTVSQTSIEYRDSVLSEGQAGAVRGGDRLPWLDAPLLGGASDNYEPLRFMRWQVHVYGEPSAAVIGACDGHRLPLHAFPWRPPMNDAGFERSAAYLVRPDGYVGMAASGERASRAIASYMERHGLLPAAAAPR